jgi:tetratricopeptide (TPR) repeat protein
MLLRERSHRPVVVYLIMAVLFSWRAYAAERFDLARLLLQSTSFDNILRTNAEQAGFIADRLPEDLPPELRSDLRRAIDSNLDYNKTEEALLRTAISKVDRSTIDLNSRWWASSSGREIAKAESAIYASLFGDSTFEAYNPTQEPQDPSNAGLVDEILRTGGYHQFVTSLWVATADLKQCFLTSVDASEQSDCAQMRSPFSGKADQLTSRIYQVATARYLKVSAGDLKAYLVYLRSPGTLATLNVLRSAERQLEQQSWQRVVQQTRTAMNAYAKSHFADVNDAKLFDTVGDIDNGRNLSRARFTLLLMSRSDPPNPAVLVQLARVTLKLAHDLTGSDNAPSVPQIDAASLESAQRYIDKAIVLDPNRADALMIRGHIAYLQRRFKESIELLEKAQAMGGTNPWLHINLGDALWAEAMQPSAINQPMSQRAADEFEAAL